MTTRRNHDAGFRARVAQELSLVQLIRDVLCRYPDAKMVGHRDLAPPLFPGFDVVSS